jgi:hypothetical protein
MDEVELLRRWAAFPEAELTWDTMAAELKLDLRTRCRDCGTTDGPGYMVTNAVWAETGLAFDGGVLCLADLSRRLGRPLRLDDFPAEIPINRKNRAAILRACMP